jgi:hypothetical protein
MPARTLFVASIAYVWWFSCIRAKRSFKIWAHNKALAVFISFAEHTALMLAYILAFARLDEYASCIGAHLGTFLKNAVLPDFFGKGTRILAGQFSHLSEV